MMPAQPPFPTAWNFPFQLCTGSQTSAWISESEDGFIVTATRQNAGSMVAFGATGALASCATAVPGANIHAPAACSAADVTVAFDSVTEVRCSHAVPGCCANRTRGAQRNIGSASAMQAFDIRQYLRPAY